MVKKFAYLSCVVLGLCLLCGCSDKVPLSGKVTFSDDGSPLTVGTVCFETDNFIAYGRVKPDGTYVIGSLSETDGLPHGNYRIFITDTAKEVVRNGAPAIEYAVAQKFTQGSTSGLTFEVTSSTKTFDFSVDRFDSKK